MRHRLHRRPQPRGSGGLVAELQAKGQRADSFPCELTDEPAVRAAVAAVLAKYGRVDCVVNNAGVNDGVGLRSPVADFRSSLEKNIVQCFVLVQATLDALIATGGTIINIGTKCSLTGQGGTSGYVAAKGAMNGLTREWALDLAKHGIRVNCILPAEVMTPMYERWISTRPDPAAAVAAINATIPARAPHDDRRGDRQHRGLRRLAPLLAHHRPDPRRRRGIRPPGPGVHGERHGLTASSLGILKTENLETSKS